jgi:hypothetical protein
MNKMLGIFSVAIVSSALLTGCGTPAKIMHSAEEVRKPSLIAGKRIALQVKVDQEYWLDGGLHFIGTEPKPGETGVREYSENGVMKNLAGEDIAKKFGTQEMISKYQTSLQDTVLQAGAKEISVGLQNPDLVVNSKLSFGPTPALCYGDYSFGKNFATGMLTLGLAPKSYQIRADYELDLQLTDSSSGKVLHSKQVSIRDSVDHSASKFSSYNTVKEGLSTKSMELFVSSMKRELANFINEVEKYKQPL